MIAVRLHAIPYSTVEFFFWNAPYRRGMSDSPPVLCARGPQCHAVGERRDLCPDNPVADNAMRHLRAEARDVQLEKGERRRGELLDARGRAAPRAGPREDARRAVR